MMGYLEKLEFSKDWTKAEDFPTYEPDESQVRADLQLLHNEAKAAINAGRSEKSSLINPGISGTENSKNISNALSAPNTAVTAILRVAG